MSTVSLTENHSDGLVEVRAGDIVAIRLPENPATGFRWDLDHVQGPLQLVDERYELDPALLGSSGAHVFSLQAEAPGEAAAQLKHWREWEGERSVTRRFRCAVTIT